MSDLTGFNRMVTLTLPYPISANRYWRTFMPRGFKAPVTTLSDEAKQYKSNVAAIIRAAGIIEPIRGRVSVSYTLFPERPQDWARRAAKNPECWDDDVRCIDLDNAQKVLLDSLKGLVFDDDKWVREIIAKRAEPDGKARLVVIVKEIITTRSQASLLEGAA